MKYLHTMVRVQDLEKSLHFYTHVLGLEEVNRLDNEQGRFTLVFLAAKDDAADMAKREGLAKAPVLELTYNWDSEAYAGGRNFGHLAYMVPDIYAFCAHVQRCGVTINRPPRDGWMAFIKSPDGISIEILQEGDPKPALEPWASMENVGTW